MENSIVLNNLKNILLQSLIDNLNNLFFDDDETLRNFIEDSFVTTSKDESSGNDKRYGKEYFYNNDTLIYEIEYNKYSKEIYITKEGLNLIIPKLLSILKGE